MNLVEPGTGTAWMSRVDARAQEVVITEKRGHYSDSPVVIEHRRPPEAFAWILI